MRTQMLLVAALGATTLSASAQTTVTDPGLYTDLDTAFEGRIRLDGGNSQTWKAAFWESSSLIQTAGNQQNVFGNGVTEAFTFSYDASTGAASLNVAGQSVSSTIDLDAGRGLAGFRFFVRSNNGGGTTTVDNMTVALDGGTAGAVPGLATTLSTNFVESDVLFFDSFADSVTITGDVTFDWQPGANLQGERFKLSMFLIDGTVVPAPGSVAMLGLGGLVAARRRR